MKIAAIQIENCLGDTIRGFYEAEARIRLAHQEGCQMAFLPELSSCGYIPNENVWLHAEPLYGPTTKWLSGLSYELGMYIGAGFCECDGIDLYNSYIIANPDGQIDGIVRKMTPESYCFRPGSYAPVIQTKIGTIGIGICSDSHYQWYLKRLQKIQPDLIVLPHAWAIPQGLGLHVSNKDLIRIEKDMTNLPRLYAACIGVPVIFVNQVGKMPQMQGLMGHFMKSDTFILGGHSQIVGVYNDNQEPIVEGIEVASVIRDVEMGVAKPTVSHYKTYGGWLHPGNFLIRHLLLPIEIQRGERFYKKSKKRKQIVSMLKKIMDASTSKKV
ncbi:MAG: carbon-nitrogen hydrolase family protein [Bacilli bacterium]